MYRFIISGISLLVLLSLSSCFNCIEGEGPVANKSRDMGEFSSVVLHSSLDIILIPAGRNAVSLEAQENLVDLVQLENRDGQLHINTSDCFRTDEKMVLTLMMNELTGVKVSGSGNIRGEGLFNVDEIDVTISGSGNILLDLSASHVYTNINGSGDIELSGITDYHEASIAGSGDIDTYGLTADHVKASIAGSGDIKVMAMQSINAVINGSGDIEYRGNPPDIETRVNGSGSIGRVDR